MKKIYYNDKDRWDGYWKFIYADPQLMDSRSYPVFPAIKHMASRGPVLECGCGLGRAVNYFHHQGFPVVGLDFDFYAVSQLKKQHNHSLVQGDARALPFKDGSFKYVCSFSVVDCFESGDNRGIAESEAYRILSGGGKLFLSVPNADSIYWLHYGMKRDPLIRKIFGKKSLPNFFGQYAFRTDEIRGELEKKGFLVEKVYYLRSQYALHQIFPFFRAKFMESQEALKRAERMNEREAFKLNFVGRFFNFIFRHLCRKYICPSLYLIASKPENPDES